MYANIKVCNGISYILILVRGLLIMVIILKFLVDEWQKEVAENLVKDGMPVTETDQYKKYTLAALYYLGSNEKLTPASER